MKKAIKNFVRMLQSTLNLKSSTYSWDSFEDSPYRAWGKGISISVFPNRQLILTNKVFFGTSKYNRLQSGEAPKPFTYRP